MDDPHPLNDLRGYGRRRDWIRQIDVEHLTGSYSHRRPGDLLAVEEDPALFNKVANPGAGYPAHASGSDIDPFPVKTVRY
ncbi:hypothetical protein PA08_1007 [Cutibacterium modestum P08]|nr:hypothetical protein PA08_1007 [Cutibacterium modestum P08]